MGHRFKPLPVLEGAQAAAVDPNVHASVSASAGSGKTQVLTGRVLSLLLNGADPSTILCVTFTKAGAAEMANRVGARHASWVRMKDNELGAHLMALRADPGPETRERARRLFAKVLEAPGGLRIQTIHSFAQTLLAAFPAEAGITPGFQPIDGRAEQELARTTLAKLLADAEARGDQTRWPPSVSARLSSSGFATSWACRTSPWPISLLINATTTASTVTSSKRSQMRTGVGAHRRAWATPRPSRTGWR